MAQPRIPARVRTHQHRRAQYALTAVHLVRRAWDRTMTPGGVWSRQGQTFSQQASVAVSAAQVATATESGHYVQETAAAAGLAGGAAGLIIPASFAGVAGNGLALKGLFDHAIVRAGQRYNELVALPVEDRIAIGPAALRAIPRDDPAQLALAEQRAFVDRVVATVMADTARAVEQAQTIAFPEIEGYVRVINPPCCSRCIILAGKFYRWDASFERHPGCDCGEIPASEADATDLKQDPEAYFHSLTKAEQDRVFTKAGAEAIRLGADPAQVVNARSGMYTATGRSGDFLATHVGITRHGAFGRINAQREAQGLHRLPHRLMPEDLIVPGDRETSIERLKTHGYYGPLNAAQPVKLSGTNAEKDAARAAQRAAAEVPVVTPPAPSSGGASGPPINPPDRTAIFGEPPDPADRDATLAYWKRRQDALPFDFAGETLEPAEVQFAERMHDLGEDIRWIATGSNGRHESGPRITEIRSTSDFSWPPGGQPWELKSPLSAAYKPIKRMIADAVSEARAHDVSKSHFVIDIGGRVLTEKLRAQLALYNQRNRASGNAIVRLIVMSRGRLIEIELR